MAIGIATPTTMATERTLREDAQRERLGFPWVVAMSFSPEMSLAYPRPCGWSLGPQCCREFAREFLGEFVGEFYKKLLNRSFMGRHINSNFLCVFG